MKVNEAAMAAFGISSSFVQGKIEKCSYLAPFMLLGLEKEMFGMCIPLSVTTMVGNCSNAAIG